MSAVSRFSLSHLSDAALQRDLVALVSKDRATTAELLAHLAELDRRRLYRKAGFDSLYEYCVRELKLSEDAAAQRIQAARVARRFPAIFAMLADGRLHLSAVRLLAPHLTRQNARELLAAAEHRTRREVEALLAERFPQPDLPAFVRPLAPAGAPDPVPSPPPAPAPAPVDVELVFGALSAITLPGSELESSASLEHAPGHVESGNQLPANELAAKLVQASTAAAGGPATARSGDTGPGDAGPSPVAGAPAGEPGARTPGSGTPGSPFTARGRVFPLSAHRFAVQVSVSKSTREKLQRATDLLAHAVPTGDLAEVLDRALDALIAKLEQRKFGATARPRAARACLSTDPRAIANEVRRAVWKRDGGQCTYVGSGGRRCESRRRLEFDHVQPVVLGGQATVANLRLRCRAHNQLTAEQAFGARHMEARREKAARASSG